MSTISQIWENLTVWGIWRHHPNEIFDSNQTSNDTMKTVFPWRSKLVPSKSKIGKMPLYRKTICWFSKHNVLWGIRRHYFNEILIQIRLLMIPWKHFSLAFKISPLMFKFGKMPLNRKEIWSPVISSQFFPLASMFVKVKSHFGMMSCTMMKCKLVTLVTYWREVGTGSMPTL